MPAINLRELSEKLGLSPTTVSRALNGYPEVSETTRLRVVAAAEQYDYRPDPRARSLATGRSKAIGHVISASAGNEMANVVFSDFIAGVGETYAETGYNILMTVVQDGSEEQAYRELATRRTVEGVMIHGPSLDDPRIPLLIELGLPFIVHGRSSAVKEPYSYVDVNNRRAIERATEFLIDLGHRRIGLVNGLEHMDFAVRRRNGYEAALKNAGITPEQALMRNADMTEPYGHRSAAEMLSLPTPPTAFIASSIAPALGIRRAIEEHGMTLGKDVSVICFDDEISYLPNGTGEPIFTATRSSVRAAGRRCAEILLAQISDPDAKPVQELWDADLVLGSSTGPAP